MRINRDRASLFPYHAIHAIRRHNVCFPRLQSLFCRDFAMEPRKILDWRNHLNNLDNFGAFCPPLARSLRQGWADCSRWMMCVPSARTTQGCSSHGWAILAQPGGFIVTPPPETRLVARYSCSKKSDFNQNPLALGVSDFSYKYAASTQGVSEEA